MNTQNVLWNDHHIPDAKIKKLWTGSHILRRILTNTKYIPDFCIQSNRTIYCLEYENSSRGFTSHICKYIQLAYENPDHNFNVTFIGSIFHKNTHIDDYIKSEITYKCCSLKNLVVEFYYDDGTGDLVIEKFNELKNLLN